MANAVEKQRFFGKDVVLLLNKVWSKQIKNKAGDSLPQGALQV